MKVFFNRNNALTTSVSVKVFCCSLGSLRLVFEAYSTDSDRAFNSLSGSVLYASRTRRRDPNKQQQTVIHTDFVNALWGVSYLFEILGFRKSLGEALPAGRNVA